MELLEALSCLHTFERDMAHDRPLTRKQSDDVQDRHAEAIGVRMDASVADLWEIIVNPHNPADARYQAAVALIVKGNGFMDGEAENGLRPQLDELKWRIGA